MKGNKTEKRSPSVVEFDKLALREFQKAAIIASNPNSPAIFRVTGCVRPCQSARRLKV